MRFCVARRATLMLHYCKHKGVMLTISYLSRRNNSIRTLFVPKGIDRYRGYLYLKLEPVHATIRVQSKLFTETTFCGLLMFLTLANQVTILRILLIFPFVICLLKTGHPHYGHWIRGVAILIFVVMAMSDALDGYLARKHKQVTALGAFLDPMADKLMITCASIVLCVPQTAIEGFVLPLTVVVLIIGKDILLLLGFIITFLLTDQVHIRPVWAGKVSTFLQIIMVFSILIGPEMLRWVAVWPAITAAICWATGFCAMVATFVYIYRGIRYIEVFGSTEKIISGPLDNIK